MWRNVASKTQSQNTKTVSVTEGMGKRKDNAVWPCRAAVPALRRLRQEDSELQAS